MIESGTGQLSCSLAAAYLAGHLLMAVSRARRVTRLRSTLLVDLVLLAFFVLLARLAAASRIPSAIALWLPLLFFWWAYLWAGRVLDLFGKPGATLDPALIRLENRWLSQPSLWLARGRAAWITETAHFFYAGYYLYTPLLGIVLYAEGRLSEFEAMSCAVMLGYAVSYTLFPILPVWGPRWGLVEAGLVEPGEQRLPGLALSRAMERLMYGVAHRGGAMPSSHSSTAVVFWIWCGRLWDWPGAAVATLLVAGMWAASVYGRYHYVTDIAAGAVIGLASVRIVEWILY